MEFGQSYMGAVGEFLEEFEFGDGIAAPGPRTPAASFTNVVGLCGPGVYALTLNGEIIYIGKAKSLIQRLYAHWNGMCRLRSGKPPFERGPKAFIFGGIKLLPCSVVDLDRVERQMIARHKPKHNKNLLPEGKLTLQQIGFDLTRLGITAVVPTPMYRRLP